MREGTLESPLEAPGMDRATISLTPTNRLVRRFQFGMAALAFKRGQEDRFVDQAVAVMSEADRNALEQPETRELFVEIMGAAFAQGGRAAAHEAGIYRRPWGFDPAEITAKTHLWYGGSDEMVPASAGKWLADLIPGSEFVLWAEHGHFTWSETDLAHRAFTTTLG